MHDFELVEFAEDLKSCFDIVARGGGGESGWEGREGGRTRRAVVVRVRVSRLREEKM